MHNSINFNSHYGASTIPMTGYYLDIVHSHTGMLLGLTQFPFTVSYIGIHSIPIQML